MTLDTVVPSTNFHASAVMADNQVVYHDKEEDGSEHGPLRNMHRGSWVISQNIHNKVLLAAYV